MFGQSLLSGAFGTALVPGDNFIPHRYIGTAANQMIGGKYGGSASFNGTDNYWVAGAGLGESGDRTRAVWVYINNMPAANNGDAVYYLGDGSSNAYYENLAVRETAGSTTYKFRYHERYDTSSNESLDSITTLTTGVWYHVAIVFDGSSRKLYVNGSLDNSATFTNKVNNTSYPLYAGTFRNTCCYLDGVLDQFRLYNTALNATQVGYLYNASNTESTTLDFPSGTGCKAAYTFNNNGNTILSQDDLDTVDFPSGAGCVGLYRLQNSGVDTAGNNNGTLVNSPGLADPLGPFGDCMDFTPASSQYINLGTGVYNGYTAMTVSAWVWYDAASNYPYTFWAGDGGTDGAGIGLALNHSTWLMYSWNGGTTQTTNTVFNAYQWYHVAVTYGGTTCKWYINGDLDSTHTVTQMNLDTSSNPTSIGYYSDSSNPGYYFDGKMAQMRIYNTALTAAQIETLAKGEPKYNGTVWPNGTGIKFNRSLNFKPDFVWIKDRTTNYSHVLIDSLRGPDSELNSNDTSAAYTETNGLTAFTSNGFNLGTLEYSYNKNNDNYISWDWKAGADIYAGLFNGTSSYIDTGYTLPALATISFSLWFKTTTTGSQMFLFGDFSSSGANASGRLSLSIESSNNFGIRTGNGSSYFTDNTTASASSYQDGNWHHAVLTANGTALKLYVDDSLIANVTSSVAVGTAGAQSTTLGRLGDYNISHFNGQLDQVRIFNTELTASQVTSLYGETSGNNNTLNFPAGAECAFAYTFDNTANPVVNETGLVTCDFPSGAGCQLLYEFNNNVLDTCGSYNGTSGGTLTYSNGIFGSAVDTTSGYLDTGYTMPADSTMSISFWMKMTANPASDVYLFSDMDSGTSNRRLDVRIAGAYSNKLYIDNGDGSSNNQQDTGWIPTQNIWYNVTITFNGTAVVLYINGAFTYSYTSSVALGTAGGQAQVIGRAGHYACCNFPGLIDQFRIFTSTLTQSQVTELQKPQVTPTSVTYVKPGYTGRNNDGNVESQVSANQDAGFSIVEYIGNGTSGATIGHGLGKIPELAFFKNIDQGSSSYSWSVYSGPNGPTGLLYLNDTYGFTVTSSRFNDTAPTNQVFTLGNDGTINASGDRHIAYCWTSIDKYSKIGSYTGNGSSTGPIVSTGFKPGWLMVKNTVNGATSWGIVDSKRSPVNPRNLYLFADWAGAESSTGDVDFNDTGFQIKSSSNFLNQSGNEIIYMAFAE